MKILHLANVIGHHKGGGVHEVVSNCYRNQKFLKHEPHIWYPGSDEDANSIRLDDNIKGLPTFGNSKYGLIKGLFQKLTKEIESFDIIHQHGIWTPMSLYSSKLRRKSGTKAVIQTHGLLLPFSRNLSKYKKQLAFLFFEKSNLLSAQALVACSLDEAKALKKIFPLKDISIIPNGVPLNFFNALNLREIEQKNKKRILFLSQIIPVKGVERVLFGLYNIGINKFKDWEFIIAGYHDKNYKRYLDKIIDELKLNKLVKFVGPKFGQEKIHLFDNSDVFVLPSFSEGSPLVVLEALSRGVPVLTTKGAPWQELNTHRCGFWVDNDNDGIETGLLKILETTELELFEMGKRGRELIKKKYLWNKTILNTIELYKWVINGGVKPDFFI